jgi:hypothetical protein
MVKEGGTTYKRYNYCRMEHGKISSSIPRDNYTVQILKDRLHRFYREATFFASHLFRSGEMCSLISDGSYLRLGNLTMTDYLEIDSCLIGTHQVNECEQQMSNESWGLQIQGAIVS